MNDSPAPAPAAAPPADAVPPPGGIGVLLVNLGTPEGTDYWSMRRYLAEFLSDRRVIEWPRAYWYPILYGIVLNRRPQRVGKAYAAIWNRDKNESWLRTHTRSQAEGLARRLAPNAPRVRVDWAMRYGRPSIPERLAALRGQGCDRILIFPLYPQYSASTTATVNDKAFAALAGMRWQPAIRTVPPYPGDPVYIEALAASVRAHVAGLDWTPEVILASFHGIPQSYSRKGDPYYHQCMETGRLLRAALGRDGTSLITTFQSRFGPEEWLQPYTDGTLERLASEGIKRVAVLNPGFVSDCLETLEEIAVLAADAFRAKGGEKFAHIPCLNDGELGLRVIEHVVRRELQGWA